MEIIDQNIPYRINLKRPSNDARPFLANNGLKILGAFDIGEEDIFPIAPLLP
jgi:hypothetical protein